LSQKYETLQLMNNRQFNSMRTLSRDESLIALTGAGSNTPSNTNQNEINVNPFSTNVSSSTSSIELKHEQHLEEIRSLKDELNEKNRVSRKNIK
jgi:hypothetical protein